MTNIMNCLVGLENATKAHRLELEKKDLTVKTACKFAEKQVNEAYAMTDGKIVLDPKLDPDPYGYHGIPLSTRFAAMGWPQ
jgi:hypothetical protein